MSTGARRSFAPTVAAGLVGAGVATWAARHDTVQSSPVLSPESRLPVVAAVGLVVLAAWGAVLFTRARLRRVLVVILALAALGLLAATLLADAPWSTGRVVALAAALVTVAAAVVAVGWGRSWPEMGQRYDAPGTPSPRTDDAPPDTNLDWWKALDEGEDPTAGDKP